VNGGAGGTVRILKCGTLVGGGVLRADGGRGGGAPDDTARDGDITGTARAAAAISAWGGGGAGGVWPWHLALPNLRTGMAPCQPDQAHRLMPQ